MADKKKVIEIKVEVEGAKQSMDNLDKGVKKVDSSGQAMGNTLDNATGGAISKFKALRGGIGNAITGFKSLRVAIIGTGIGALLIAIVAVASAFKGSEEGQNKFAKLMGVIGSVVGNVMDVLSDLGEFIIDLFSGDGAAMSKLKSFGASIFNVIGLPIKNVIDTVKALGKALGALFSGDVSGAFDALKQGVQDVKGNFNEAADSINGATDALKRFGEEAIKEAKIAADIADKRAKADKLERDLILEKAKGEKEIAELRLKAKDLNNTTAKEREDALRKVISIQDKLTNKEIEAATLRRDAVVEENKLSKSNKDALTAEAEAEAKLIQLQTAKANKARTVQSEITAAENAARSDSQAKAKEADTKRIEAEKAKATALEAIRVGQIDTEEERRAEELRKVKEHYKGLLDQAKKYYGENSTQQEELERAQKTKENELKDKHDQEDKDRAAKIKAEDDAEKLKAQEAKLEELELTKEFDNLQFEEQREILKSRQALLDEDTMLSDEQKLEMQKKYSQASAKIDDIEQKQKLDNAKAIGSIASGLSDALGKENEAGKALGAASALINTYTGMAEIWGKKSDMPTVATSLAQKIAGTVTVATTGFAAVKNILAVNPKGEKSSKGGGGGLSAVSGATAKRIQAVDTRAQDSSFDSVGNEQSARNAQAQSNVNAQSDSPLRAYVTSTDVVSGAQFERNRVDVAGF